MSIDKKQVESMAAIMAAMNSATESDADGNPLKAQKKVDPALGSIMEAFRKATDGVAEISEDYPELKTAITTERTRDGVNIGSWKITIREFAGEGKFYDITHKMTGDPVASDLRLYEAALGIVKALDNGETFTSPLIKSILEFENNYACALNNTLMFSHKMKITEGVQHDIAEARYSEYKRRAIAAKKTISNLLK